MQIVFRCRHCTKMTTSDKESDTCLEIDALKGEISFICQLCKKTNTVKFNLAKGEKPVSNQPLPRMGVGHY